MKIFGLEKSNKNVRKFRQIIDSLRLSLIKAFFRFIDFSLTGKYVQYIVHTLNVEMNLGEGGGRQLPGLLVNKTKRRVRLYAAQTY
jgi:hypothetical protein